MLFARHSSQQLNEPFSLRSGNFLNKCLGLWIGSELIG